MPEPRTVTSEEARQLTPNVPPDRGGVTQPGDVGVQTTVADEQAAAEAQNQAEELRKAEEAARQAEAKRDAEAAELAAGVVVEDEPAPTKVGSGGVKLTYLGTSDAFDFGPASDEDQRHVIAYAGGEPVDVPSEVADRVKDLPYDKFQETE